MVASLSPEEVARRLSERPDDLFLLDVREPHERAIALIRPSAHIPMQQVPTRAVEIPKGKEIVVYCHSGMRSMMVAGYLEGEGFPLVANLTGGIDAWSRRVDRSVPRY